VAARPRPAWILDSSGISSIEPDARERPLSPG
jgi:hypothetical protein